MVTSKWLVETRENNKNKKLETIVEVVTLAGNLSLINQDLIVLIFFSFFLYIESILKALKAANHTTAH